MPSTILLRVGVLYGDSFDEEARKGFDNAMFKSTYMYMLVSLQFYSCLQCVCVHACVCVAYGGSFDKRS